MKSINRIFRVAASPAVYCEELEIDTHDPRQTRGALRSFVKFIAGAVVTALIAAAAVPGPVNNWLCGAVSVGLICDDELLAIGDQAATQMSSDFFALWAGLPPPPFDSREYKDRADESDGAKLRGREAWEMLSEGLKESRPLKEFLQQQEQLRWAEAIGLIRQQGPRNSFQVTVRYYGQTSSIQKRQGMPGTVETRRWVIRLVKDQNARRGFTIADLRGLSDSTTRLLTFPAVTSPGPTSTYYLPTLRSGLQSEAEKWARVGAEWYVLCQVQRQNGDGPRWWARTEHGWIPNMALGPEQDAPLAAVSEMCSDHHVGRDPAT